MDSLLTLPGENVTECQPLRETVKGSLESTKRNLEARLAKINAGLEVLEKDPKLAEQLEVLTKALRA